MEGSDVCFAPALGLEEAPQHTHVKARETFVSPDGITQPAPRFSRTPGTIRRSSPSRGEGGEQALID